MTDLSEYEAAFERVERRLQLQRDWGLTEARVRRRLHRPTWSLVKTVVSILVCIGGGVAGVLNGWLVAGGLALAVLPGRIAKYKKRHRVLRELGSAEEVRELCLREAHAAASSAMLGGMVLLFLGLTFFLTAFIAWTRDRSPTPGVLAGLVVLAWGAVRLLVFFPRAQREVNLLDEDDDEEDEDAD